MTDVTNSVPALVVEHAQRNPRGEAVRYKRHAVWRSVTWEDLAARVAALAHSLKGLGVGESSLVGLLGDNCYEWIVADVAVQSLGANSLILPRGLVAATLGSNQLDLAFCKDQGDVEDLMAGGKVPAVVVVDPVGCSTLGSAGAGSVRTLVSYDELVSAPSDTLSGADSLSGLTGTFATSGALRVDAAARSAAVVSRLTAAELHAAAQIGAQWLELSERDRVFCAAPFSNASSYFVDVYAALFAGTTICLPETALSLLADLREAQPTVLCLPSRGLDLLRTTSEGRAARSTRGRAWVCRTAMRRLRTRVVEGRVIAARSSAAYALVGSFVRRQLGLRNTRRIVAFGAPVGEETRVFLASLGVPAIAAYGNAGTRGLVVAGNDGTAGDLVSPLPGLRARVRADRHLDISWETSGQRWLDTGLTVNPADASTFRLIGARDDEFEVNGAVVAPEPIERALQVSPLVRHAVVVEHQGALAALLELDIDAVRSWAREQGVPGGSLQALGEHRLVRRELWELVGRVNTESGRTAGFAIAVALPLPRQLSEQDGELDPVHRPVRVTIEQNFADCLPTGITAAEWDVAGSHA